MMALMRTPVLLALFAAGPAFAQDLVVDNTTLTLDGTQTYESVSVVNGGVIYVTAYNGGGTTGTLQLIADSVVVDASSSILASGAGYRGVGRTNGEGPGGGQGGDCCQDSGGGGAHGGDGGYGSRDWGGGVDGAGGTAYGSATSHDIDMGSAGGAAGSGDGDAGGPGANAGGSIWIQAAEVTMAGSITTNGSNGTTPGNDAAGGGAGGGILIEAGTLNCTGSLSANGGNGGVIDDAGGGGGGGVVKQFHDAVLNLCSVSVNGGTTSRGATNGSVGITASGEYDFDGDGYTTTSGDCDPGDAAISPNATEVCDGIDNDCDSTTDEPDSADAITWYADSDLDGFGDSGTTTNSCDQPSGFVSDTTDCDDTNGARNPGHAEVCDGLDNNCDTVVDEGVETSYYLDADGDGYGDVSQTLDACTAPSGYVADGTDCDDTDPALNPSDSDSDGTSSCGGDCDDTDAALNVSDADGDGASTCTNDCDDSNAAVHPAATETCNGVDDDCDGSIDAGATDAIAWYADSDADGYGDANTSTLACSAPSGHVVDTTDCDDTSASVNPGATETCNGVDDDCDGDIDEAGATGISTWYADTDGDGHGDAGSTVEACGQPTGFVASATDCDDTDPAVSPDATEDCNGVDDDCDGTIDEPDSTDALTWYADADGDGFGDAASSVVSCDAPSGYVSDSTDCDDSLASTFPGATETWYDGVDADCDGASDFDADADGYDADGHGGTDCDDEDAAINPDAPDAWYDGIDANCDGASDFDADGDGFDSASYGGDDCDDSRADTYPGAPDVPHDGEITDCDLTSDNDADGDGFDSVEYGGDDCDDANSAVNPEADETWYDGVDDNCDGNDNDQDEDGFAFEDDCDDTDDSAYPGAPGWSEDCEPIDSGVGVDTSVTDTGFDTGADAAKLTGGSGCSCSSTSSTQGLAPLGLFFGLVLLLRRRSV